MYLSNNQNDKQALNEVYQILKQFYQSFFSNIYNELNILKYKKLRDSIGLVIYKFDTHDHPQEYCTKLVMFIQAYVTIHHLHLSSKQQYLLKSLSTKSKGISLRFLYTGPIMDDQQFLDK
ncbi:MULTISPECIES: bacteriocin immunity protein [unclassified Lactobacillus]|uniref:bacteriocin immunity protein n=1 Tax=unclassified Lactobacillus TaxID=2620435 RepID=UPI000EFB8653|nr:MULTISPECIES: bacteriocin immunity protein [unclassified Lactobacillus]RMC24870.1 bacteriocin immunity protein [Lactobacillus sp. ESL0247]RMC29024.1 bacteriocin immunity protein [Lactobacillus sp. ESL0246]RMC32627.1 bacteriocin immunity protein [Lactobacillus sp. ESL0245]